MSESTRPELFFGLFASNSPEMSRVYHLISKVASASYPVVIIGETGTGKELVARAIHLQARTHRSFVAVDCSAVPATVFEAEMFGCVKGAYTGAIADRTGLMEAADKGSLFLDEIGNLPLDLQPKLLRALQEREVRPVGSNLTRPFDARILAAANVPLEDAVAQGRFRTDLYHRLNVFQISLPPLRSRPEDIEPLVRHIIAQYSQEIGYCAEISPNAVQRLQSYGWPGNIRELQNVVRRAMAMEEGPVLEFMDFQPHEVVDETLASIEKRAIFHALRTTGDKLRAAKILGIGKTTLYRKLKEYAHEAVVTSSDREPDSSSPSASSVEGAEAFVGSPASSDQGATTMPTDF